MLLYEMISQTMGFCLRNGLDSPGVGEDSANGHKGFFDQVMSIVGV